ncbi:MAG TPA: exonuclease domain-containing protein [Bacteroidia bacterium]|jgi:DNA polymerase-3 subunit epsilon|nr:exonuclease domain-containing protein [Bacteroidia bacterium]
MFAIIDIETCGNKFEHPRGRIIDIAILIHDGLQVVERFSTLINPGCHISGFYSKISGITDEMVADAPQFHQVAKQIVELTEGKIFVAHNVGFDYSFVKEEFAFLGYKFRREKLCTVRLSRKLMPDRISYSLGHLCASLGIPIEGRHRALGDADATAKLFDLLIRLKSEHPQYKNMGVERIMTRRIDKIKEHVLKKLPEECGVYYFQDRKGNIIYVGKSTNIYNRAMSHFNTKERKGKKMLNELYDASYIQTGSELIALILEDDEIKKRKPQFNRARKSSTFTHSIDYFEDEKGVLNFRIVEYGEAQNPMQSFTTYATARERLDSWIDEHILCLRYCGLTDDDAICFNHHIKKCNGICSQQEDIEVYNKRAKKILSKYTYRDKNFMLIDKGRTSGEKSFVLVQNGHYAGYGYFDATTQLTDFDELKELAKMSSRYPDTDDLIRGFMRTKPVKYVSLEKAREV